MSANFKPVRPARPPSAVGAAKAATTAPKPPKRLKPGQVNASALQAYPDPTGEEDGYYWPTRPLTEWVTYWTLKHKLGGRLGKDFLYQHIIPVAQVNVSGRGYRSDFWILPRGRFGGIGPPYSHGVLIDPVSNYTHKTTGEDRFRRGVLGQAGYLLVWIDDYALYLNPIRLVRLAVQGIDVSSINRGAR